MFVLEPDVDTTTPPPQKHHQKTPKTPPQKHQKHHDNLAKHRKLRVLGPDVDTTTPHHLKNTTTKTPKTPPQSCKTPKNTSSRSGCNRLQFLDRMLQRQKRQKSTSFIVKTLCKSIAEHRKVRELLGKMNIEEVDEPETTKIYRQNPRAPAAATRKLRKFTDETNMQARNQENSDEFRTQPVRHLDLATPAFYHYRKNPKCYHTVWGT